MTSESPKSERSHDDLSFLLSPKICLTTALQNRDSHACTVGRSWSPAGAHKPVKVTVGI